jgi:hypothetical protein
MRLHKIAGSAVLALLIGGASPARADAPAWMHNLVNAPVPAHDEKADAAVMYSEEIITVQSAEKVRRTVRRAYKILRPNGREHGVVFVPFNQHSKVTGIKGWCIPVQGKDYEVKEKDAMEISLPKIAGSELISDVKDKMLQIPAADPGNIVGYEFETEESPIVLQSAWAFQGNDPVKDAKFTLILPAGWEYSAVWRNHADVKPTQSAANQWLWSVSDVKGIGQEEEMPPWPGVAGEMVVTYFPPGGASNRGFRDWKQMGVWFTALAQGRRDTTPEIKRKVAALTASGATPVEKMAALASFVQQDIRYVAIELGIGGIQPHAAGETFQHRYGDCKDKATLMGTMLKEMGVDSYYVIINSERGSVDTNTPAQISAFDHAIIAIKMPDGAKDAPLPASVQHPTLGEILFFDPTDELVPFGQLNGALQENYGLLVGPDGGELVKLPRLASALNGITRSAVASLDGSGNLSGTFEETRHGDLAAEVRARMKTVAKDQDRAKVIEGLLTQSLANFSLAKAGMGNLQDTSKPFLLTYSLSVRSYAKTAGDLLLVRPRLVGIKGSGLLETKEPRQLPVIFDGPRKDTDTFEIVIPAGYEVDDLPPPTDIDYSFASYHSKTEVSGNKLKYTRTFEIKELSVPLEKMEDLKKFYRVIGSDERNTAVLKPSTAAASAK